MNIIRAAIDRPIAVVAAIIMAVMFGYVALTQIPVQLAPDVDKPIINVQKKKVFGAIKARYEKTKVKLPTTVYLPPGEYRANGAPFKIERGKEAKAVLFLFAEPGGGGTNWLVVGGVAAGAVALLGGIAALVFIVEDKQEIGEVKLVTGLE